MIQQGPTIMRFKLQLFNILKCVITFLHAVNILIEREHILTFEVDLLHIDLL